MTDAGFLCAGFRCPCCGAKTLSTPTTMELCPVCWWEDDGQDGEPGSADAAEVRLTVNGELSLRQARLNFQACGAAHPRFVRYVRPALPEEI
ncbi:CPCC family cysteine-rich protein [Acidicapsa ligni]|uniref:CPCC family cysteine-rich protein n=1 Tax=Acidicapsa ligni TaxID=542300 RepID=UPI0021E06B24|nr:CPCC family cysteine-rich protein [Acidicapsa ligni]